jgi:pyruvate dehydrogenase E1 component alpha subunit
MNPDGSLVPGARVTMDVEVALEALRWMLFSRTLDERLIVMQRQGQMGVYAPVIGQEAAVVGSSMALDPARDWLVPQYRETIAYIRHGWPLERLLAANMGKAKHGAIPEGVNMLPLQLALAAHLPHAAGLAWGLKLWGSDRVVMAYIGEGGSSEGDFHEALNLAGVVNAPVMFLLQNNQWAISTPRRLQSAAACLALRAAGYGFPGIGVDGNDVMAVFGAATEAVDRARGGGGPTLIEAVTYRMSFHNTTDNPRLYLDIEEHEQAGKTDPLPRMEAYLSGVGLWNEELRDRMLFEINAEIDQAVRVAVGFPAPEPTYLFENVYAHPPRRVLRQRAR